MLVQRVQISKRMASHIRILDVNGITQNLQLQPLLNQPFPPKPNKTHHPPPPAFSPNRGPPASTFLLLNFQAFLGSHPPNVAVSPTRAHTAPGSRDASAARGDRAASTRQPPRLTEADSTGRRRSTPFSCKDTQPRSGPGD